MPVPKDVDAYIAGSPDDEHYVNRNLLQSKLRPCIM